jgi:hypothetical protein
MIAGALLAWALSQTPAAPPLPPSTVALVETYADGRTQYELTSAKPAWSWTITFPRLKNWQQPAGTLPVRAVQFDRVLTTNGVKVDVSVLLGPQYQRVPVESVIVHDSGQVVITRLREYGVEPVDLSLAEVAPITPYLPTVFSATPNIECREQARSSPLTPAAACSSRASSRFCGTRSPVPAIQSASWIASGLKSSPSGTRTTTNWRPLR